MRILLAIKDLGYRGMPKVVASYARILSRCNEVAIWAWNSGGQTAEELCDEGFLLWVGMDRKGAALRFAPEILNIHRHGVFDQTETNIMKDFAALGAKCVETNVFGRIDETIYPYIAGSIQISKWDLFQYNSWKPKAAPESIYCPNPVPVDRYGRISEKAIEKTLQEWGIPLHVNNVPSFVIGRIGNTSWDALSIPLREQLEAHKNYFFVHVADHSNRTPEWVENHRQVRVIQRLRGFAELSAFYSACNVCISMSTIGESFGLVNVESIACGTPVVALSSPLHCNAICETVGKSHGGIVIASPRELGRAISRIASNAGGYVDMDYAHSYVVSEYGERKVKDLLEAYFSAIKSSRDDRSFRLKLKETSLMTSFNFGEIIQMMNDVNAKPSFMMRLAMQIYYSRFGYIFFLAIRKVKALSVIKSISRALQ